MRAQDPAGGDLHTRFEEMAAEWALYSLELADEEMFAAHLSTCHQCQRTVPDYEAVAAELAGIVPDEALPDDAWARLFTRLDQPAGQRIRRPVPVGREASTDDGADGSNARGSGTGRGRVWLAAASVVLILVAGGLDGWNISLRSASGRQQQAVQALLRASSQSTLRSDDGRTLGYVLGNPDGVDIANGALLVNDPSSSTYVLWALHGKKAPTAVGTFDVYGGDLTVSPVSGGSTSAPAGTGYAVSKEPGRRAPTAPSSVLAATA